MKKLNELELLERDHGIDYRLMVAFLRHKGLVREARNYATAVTTKAVRPTLMLALARLVRA